MKTLALLTLAGALAFGAAATLQFKPGSTIKVEGTSNVHGWSCESSQMAGTLETIGDGLSGISGGRLTIPVQALECGNSTMNRLMRDALKAGQNPQIRYAISNATVSEPDVQGRHTVTANGRLTIAGQTQTVRVRAQATATSNGTYRLTGTVPLTMTQFGVDPPRAMMGSMRTADAITISFNVLVGQ